MVTPARRAISSTAAAAYPASAKIIAAASISRTTRRGPAGRGRTPKLPGARPMRRLKVAIASAQPSPGSRADCVRSSDASGHPSPIRTPRGPETRGGREPVAAGDDVLIRVYATTVNRTDCGFRWPTPFIVRFSSGLLRRKRSILATELAGEVEAIGAGVTEFVVGDRVFGVSSCSGRRPGIAAGSRP